MFRDDPEVYRIAASTIEEIIRPRPLSPQVASMLEFLRNMPKGEMRKMLEEKRTRLQPKTDPANSATVISPKGAVKISTKAEKCRHTRPQRTLPVSSPAETERTMCERDLEMYRRVARALEKISKEPATFWYVDAIVKYVNGLSKEEFRKMVEEGRQILQQE